MMNLQWPLPQNDPWSTPFAETLLEHLDLFEGASVLDIAAGSGIPAFHLAEKVGSQGQVLAIDIHPQQILRARNRKQSFLPHLQFEIADMKQLPPSLPQFDRITGNLSFMFFRPDRLTALKNLISFLKPGGQIVLTFPSLGTFDSLWDRVAFEMNQRKLSLESKALTEYIEERPSANQARQWLEEIGMNNIRVTEHPLEIATGPGLSFLEHPLLRGGFLEDVYECFQDQGLAEEFMTTLSQDIDSFTPLVALRCAMSGWKPMNASN